MSRFASLSGRKPVLRWPSTALFALAPERSKRVLGGKRHPGIQSVAVLRAALPLYPHASRRAVELLPRERRTQTPVTRHDHCISMLHAGYPKARSGRPAGLPEHVRTHIRDIHAPPPMLTCGQNAGRPRIPHGLKVQLVSSPMHTARVWVVVSNAKHRGQR